MTILIVDDSQMQRRLLGRLLVKAGHADVLEADSAEACLALLATATGAGVDMVLMDVNMPGMDGIEACRRLKSDPRWRALPVIIVTGEEQDRTLEAAFDAGADDYVHKPVGRIELLARVRAALALKAETDRRRAREREIAEIGAMIQQRLLAGQPPEEITGATVAALARPSLGLDGDFYEFFKHGDRCFDLVIADVMGKGLPAAMLGAAVKNRFFKALSELYARGKGGGPPAPDRIVGRVHDEMTPELIRLNAFVTLCYARIDLTALTLEVIDAGHPRPILFRHATRQARNIEGDNAPIGFDPHERYRARRVYLIPGDLLLFYSDGLTDARSPDGDTFGAQRLIHYLTQVAHRPPGEVIKAIDHRLALFTRGDGPRDDMTCIAVRIDATAARSARLAITSEMRRLPAVRRFINEFCEAPGWPAIAPRARWQIALGLNEAVANIIRHAYGARPGQPIHIQVAATADRVRIEVAHQGLNWQPTSTPLPQADRWQENGYGLFIMENYIDEVVYATDGDGHNRIVLEKHLAPPAADGPPPATGA